MQIRLAGTVNDSIVDGPGIRFSIFTQGCSHQCPGCQNPQTWSFDGGELVDTDDLLARIAKNPLLKGITLTGGEPFEQAEPLVELCTAVRERGLDVWAYSGFTFEQIVAGEAGEAACALLELCDVLVDGPFLADLQSYELKWRGSSNQRVIDVPASLAAGSVVERA